VATTPERFTERQDGLPPSAPQSASAGIPIPPRRSDCSGVRPSWFPFQINVCDEYEDDPDFGIELGPRHMTIG
jgi:hypothetical protein